MGKLLDAKRSASTRLKGVRDQARLRRRLNRFANKRKGRSREGDERLRQEQLLDNRPVDFFANDPFPNEDSGSHDAPENLFEVASSEDLALKDDGDADENILSHDDIAPTSAPIATSTTTAPVAVTAPTVVSDDSEPAPPVMEEEDWIGFPTEPSPAQPSLDVPVPEAPSQPDLPTAGKAPSDHLASPSSDDPPPPTAPDANPTVPSSSFDFVELSPSSDMTLKESPSTEDLPEDLPNLPGAPTKPQKQTMPPAALDPLPTPRPTKDRPSAPPPKPKLTRRPTIMPTISDEVPTTQTKYPTKTKHPTKMPAIMPVLSTDSPTFKPTRSKKQSSKTHSPTFRPSNLFPSLDEPMLPKPPPTHKPTPKPVKLPTLPPPTDPPTDMPTQEPTVAPTLCPTMEPTTQPPTQEPNEDPTVPPTETPTDVLSSPPTPFDTSVCKADAEGNYGFPTAPDERVIDYEYQVEVTARVTEEDLNNVILLEMEKDISDVLVPELFFQNGECDAVSVVQAESRRSGNEGFSTIEIQGIEYQATSDKRTAQDWALGILEERQEGEHRKPRGSRTAGWDTPAGHRNLEERRLQESDELVGLTASPPDFVIRDPLGRLQNACPFPVTGTGPDGQPLVCWVIQGRLTVYGFGDLSWVEPVVHESLNVAMANGEFDNGAVNPNVVYVRSIPPGTELNVTVDAVTDDGDTKSEGTPVWAWVLIGLGIFGLLLSAIYLLLKRKQQQEEFERQQNETEFFKGEGEGGDENEGENANLVGDEGNEGMGDFPDEINAGNEDMNSAMSNSAAQSRSERQSIQSRQSAQSKQSMSQSMKSAQSRQSAQSGPPTPASQGSVPV